MTIWLRATNAEYEHILIHIFLRFMREHSITTKCTATLKGINPPRCIANQAELQSQ